MTANTAARRITPTGRLILPASAPRDQWLAERRNHLGSSDAPKILGIYGSALAVWHDKYGDLPDEDNEAMLWGRLDENTIAQEWCRRNASVVRRVGLVANIDEPYLACTLDRRVLQCPLDPTRREQCALEVKLRSAFTTGRWTASGVPDDVLAQVAHQLHVTGYDHIHVAVRIGSSDYRQRTIHADRERAVIDYVIEQERTFWRDHFLTNRPPPHNGTPDNLLDLHDRLHPDRAGNLHLDVEQWADATALLAEYAAAHAAMLAARARKTQAQAELVAMLGDAEIAIAQDQVLFSYREQAGPARADLDRLAERWPDAYADVVTATTQRRFDAGLRRARKEPSHAGQR